MPGLRILVVRLGAMGDILHALPAAASLKQSFPRSHLVWAVEERWTPLLSHNPFVDEVIPADRRSLRSILAMRKKLREKPFDIAIDFQGLLKSALVASIARPESIYGFDYSQLREPLAALFYSRAVKTNAAHVIDQNLELAKAAGATVIVRTFAIPRGSPEGVLPTGDFVLASPFAGWASKQWPLENYSQLGCRLMKESGLRLVLNVAPETHCELPNVWLHASGLSGLIDATRRAVAVVGVDSGPMHLAAALGKPGVAIFGPTDSARNGPYGSSLAVLRSPAAVTSYKRCDEIDPSMRDITADAVFECLKSRMPCPAES